MMKDDNEDDLKNKEDLHIGGRHTALDIFRFAVFFSSSFLKLASLFSLAMLSQAKISECGATQPSSSILCPE